MSAAHPEGSPGSVHDDQLAWDFEAFARGGRVNNRPPEVFLSLGREMIRRLATSKSPISSSAGIEMAFQSVLDDSRDGMSLQDQERLSAFIFLEMPGQVEGFQPDSDPYFLASASSLGPDAAFEQVIRPIAGLDDTYRRILDETANPQLSMEDDGSGPARNI